MRSLYASPFRVYLLLGVLALIGIWCGTRLPVSLFPNSTKPSVGVGLSYGSSTAEEFLSAYGRAFEDQLRSVTGDTVQLETLQAEYDRDGAHYKLEFKWGNSPVAALKEVQLVANSFASAMPAEMRDTLNVWMNQENNGFLAVSFYSATRSLDDLYDYLEPLLSPQLAKIPDAAEVEVWNPSRKEIRLELVPERMATLQLFPRDVERAVSRALNGFGGGSITIGTRQLGIQLLKPVHSLPDLGRVVISTRGGRAVHLSDVARIDYGLKTTGSRSFKTSGQPSIIVFASPKAGGNVKRMAEDILAVIRKAEGSFPADIQYRVLVDPSEFIRSAIRNVFHEVAIGALLAVTILFIFIGSVRNTVTAAIEIPLSMVLAFILMRLSGMNLNLISLGGLALSAGMNVDASVVVMENIFRRFEEKPGKLSFTERLDLIVEAVKEVRFAVIASTIASLVVFVPLAFTSDLSYAILGDLAKTVVFSHGFSAFVALILVPTVRLHLLGTGKETQIQSPLDRQIRTLESGYARALGRFIAKRPLRNATYAGLLAVLGLLVALVLPRLPKELIGTPDTDWMVLAIRTSGNTLLQQMVSQTEEVETELLKNFGDNIQYTFTQVQRPNQSNIMARLKNRGETKAVWKAMEEKFVNTPFVRYWVGPWNPAELPIPDPPQLRVVIRGGSLEARAEATEDLLLALNEKQVLPRLWAEPEVSRTESVVLRANPDQWAALTSATGIEPADIADLARVATSGRRVGRMMVGERNTDIYLRYPDGTIRTSEDLGALPVGLGSRLVPLKALAQLNIEKLPPSLYREDGRELFMILGRQNESAEGKKDKGFLKTAEELVAGWNAGQSALKKGAGTQPVAALEDAEKDMTTAFRQLGWAIALSVALIFLTLILQFGDLMNALLVLVAVPLGFVGVLISLFVFGSTLSLNSVLGVILLNGIAVANSIILVDFLKRLVEAGRTPEEAAIEAARKRLRPILITSLTTVLGMLPIALGMGEGGRILQPLGIAVSGGLWVSMGLTLFVVPALQVSYLNWKRARVARRAGIKLEKVTLAGLSLLLLGVCATSAAQAAESGDGSAPRPFAEALERIVERSTAVQRQRAALEEARARALPSRLFLLPELGLSAVRTQRGTDLAGDLTRTSQQWEATASLNLFRFGGDISRLRAALSEIDGQEAQLRATLLEAEGEGISALLNVVERTRLREISAELVRLEGELLAISRQRYEKGLLPLQEVDKVAIDRENAQSRLTDAQVREVDARSRLVALLGDDRVELRWPWKDELAAERAFAPVLAEGAFRLEARPDAQAAEARLAAERDRLRRAYQDLLPTLDASFTYGLYQPVLGAGEEGPRNHAWAGSIGVTIPLFSRLSSVSEIRAQAARRESSEASLEAVRRQGTQEWESSREVFRLMRESAVARDRVVQTARRLYEDNQKRFQQGRISTNDLFLDQARLFESESNAIQSWSSAHRALTQLCHALGRRVGECWRKAP